MPITHESFLKERRFGSLDGLRALSIVSVIFHHTAGESFGDSHLAHAGAEGVTLFFAISGFLITTLLLRERERRGAIDLPAFYVRRSLRIFPLYYAVLLLYVGVVYALERHTAPGQQFFRNLPFFATYTSNWFVPLEGRVIFYFAWSLASEEQFYLVWPPLLRAVPSVRAAFGIAGGLVLALALVELWAFAAAGLPAGHVAAVPEALFWGVMKIPPAILLGVCGALLLHTERGFRVLAPVLGGRSASAVCLALAVLALTIPGTPRMILHLAMSALVIACVIRSDHALRGFLALSPLVYLGSISYGLYLYHVLVKNAVAKAAARLLPAAEWWLVFPTTLAIATLVAGLSFRYFETPLLDAKKRFER